MAARARGGRKVERRVAFSIAVIAALLAGVVALNVAVLRLNVSIDELDQQRAKLHSEKSELVSRLAGELVWERVEERAQIELGLVPVNQAEVRYIDLGGP